MAQHVNPASHEVTLNFNNDDGKCTYTLPTSEEIYRPVPLVGQESHMLHMWKTNVLQMDSPYRN